MMKNYGESVKIDHNPNLCRILIIGGSGKTNVLLTL